jgi:type II protein arginine methyltransferase
MLNDNQRNLAFHDAIMSVDMAGKTVLDIGTGTGLLSMIAAKNGAKHMYTCEANQVVAEMAVEIIAQNGYADRITVINKLSTDLIPGVDLPHNMEILISETVDCGFVGEGFIPALIHAKRELLAANAIILPQGVKLHANLLSSDDVSGLNRVEGALGFNLELFNRFASHTYFPVRLNTWSHHLIADDKVILEHNFYDHTPFASSQEVEFRSHRTCMVHGIVFWFEMQVVDALSLANSPSNRNSHWMQAVQVLQKPFAIKSGESVKFLANVTDTDVKFTQI